jgi:hypothetical protein
VEFFDESGRAATPIAVDWAVGGSSGAREPAPPRTPRTRTCQAAAAPSNRGDEFRHRRQGENDFLSTSAAMAELPSHGYFVIADDTPNGTSSRAMDSSNPAGMGQPTSMGPWRRTTNPAACMIKVSTRRRSAKMFSCGALTSEGTAGDVRIPTWGLNSSGLISANQAFYKTVHTHVLVVLGGADEVEYPNGERDYDNLSAVGIPSCCSARRAATRRSLQQERRRVHPLRPCVVQLMAQG